MFNCVYPLFAFFDNDKREEMWLYKLMLLMLLTFVGCLWMFCGYCDVLFLMLLWMVLMIDHFAELWIDVL